MIGSQSKGIYLKAIDFNDGSRIEFERSTIVLLTGPNNCGKSRTLKEIFSHPVINRQSIVTTKIESMFEGNIHDIVSDLLRHPMIKQNRILIEQSLMQSQGNVQIFLTLLSAHPHVYKQVADGFMTHLSTLTRLLGFGVAPENTNVVNVNPFGMTSLVRLYEDQDVATKVYDRTKSVFGKGVVMNHATLQDTDLYFVDREGEHSPVPEGTTAHARWFESLEKLNQQGDGVNSFATILISLFQQLVPLILLDEPEAFLHPPQIRELARIIASETPIDTQVLVSTHSDDFIRGMIDFAGERTSVVRMTRHKTEGREINRLRKLNADEISTLWNDPLLRTSDVLTSLFHQVAVIVEGDSDARFFRALIDSVAEDQHRALDVRFFHCGGKDKIYKIVNALRAIGVSVICIVDIDVLESKDKFGCLIESFGGDRSAFAKPHDEIVTFMNQKKPPLNGLVLQQEITRLFEQADLSKPLSDADARKMAETLKPPSTWALAKQTGETFFAGGSPFNMFQHICSEAKKLGVLINRGGELENYCRVFSAKRKSEWLADVLTLDLKTDHSLKDARAFVFELLELCAIVSA